MEIECSVMPTVICAVGTLDAGVPVLHGSLGCPYESGCRNSTAAVLRLFMSKCATLHFIPRLPQMGLRSDCHVTLLHPPWALVTATTFRVLSHSCNCIPPL